ncbi:helicase associated domain-containing protein [Streptomyces sp. NPDC058290]|uniref:helicase associated domain-containing protein n=1 Tax=Streptomyces sp. NPDC058290 TaxID=3346426 RepID=UPI0036EBE08D
MDEERVAQLEKLGMVWAPSTPRGRRAWPPTRGWAAEHGHVPAPLDAAFQGAAVGIWLKNARAAARKAVENEQRRAKGLPVESSAGAMTRERREQLEEIDPSWCPAWPVTWWRCFHLVRQHLEAGQALPTKAGEVVRQGENLGRWVTSVRLGWDQLTGMQQWTCEQILGIEPATEEEKPRQRTSQADKWAMRLVAAEQSFEREGHLTVPRKHVETITVGGDGGEGQVRRDVSLRLGTWVDNQRRRAAALTPERVDQLPKVGMRWA